MRGIIDSLQHSPKIRSVRMDGCGLDDHQIYRAVRFSFFLRNLRELSLDRNFCRSNGVDGIARILSMGRLEKLNLSSQVPPAGGLRLDISPLIRLLRNDEYGVCSLRELDLSRNNLEDSDFLDLGESMKYNTTS